MMSQTGDNRTKSAKRSNAPERERPRDSLQSRLDGRVSVPTSLLCRKIPGLAGRLALPKMGFETGSGRFAPRRCRGFSLIELILVMTMLMIVLAVAFPSLKSFFRGRDLDSEALRFLSLTRYGQSRAISEGVPMMLWIDARQGVYGLETQTGYTDADGKAMEFELDDELSVEVPMAAAARSTFSQHAVAGLGNVPAIRFQPDGFVSETSPESIVIRQGRDDAIWITQSANRLNYEIQANPPPNAR